MFGEIEPSCISGMNEVPKYGNREIAPAKSATATSTVIFGLFSKVGDYRISLLCAGFLFIPAALIAWRMPELRDSPEPSAPVE